MTLLKNAKIAEKYGVFRGSVGKWVAAAVNKENNLQLEMSNNKWYVIDNQHNHSELSNLAERALKYRNKSSYEKVIVDPELYKIFSYGNLVELITKMEENRLIPIKFSYLNSGAIEWDNLIEKASKSENFYGNKTDSLLHQASEYLMDVFNKYDTVNMVDVGPGNGFVVRPLITKLMKMGFKVEYTAIDISQKMLDIVSKNINNWFPKIEVHTEIGDMDYMVIREKLFSNKLANPNSCNLILFLGATIGNVYDRHRVFRNFFDSMSSDDFFVLNNVLDLVSQRAQFKTLEEINTQNMISWIPEKLGLRPDMYEKINKYDEKTASRLQVLKLNKDVDVEFQMEQGVKVVNLQDGEEITIFNHYSHTMDSLIKDVREVGLGISYLSRTPNHSQALIICESEI